MGMTPQLDTRGPTPYVTDTATLMRTIHGLIGQIKAAKTRIDIAVLERSALEYELEQAIERLPTGLPTTHR